MPNEARLTDTDQSLCYRLFDEAWDMAIFTLDSDGNIASWNNSARRLFGFEQAEVLSRSLSVFYPIAEVATGEPGRQLEIAKSQGRFEDRAWRVKKDRTVFWAHFVILPIVGPEGQLQGYSKIFRDESAQKKAEDFNKQMTSVLEKKVQERTEELTQVNETLRLEVLNRKRAEEILRRREAELHEAQRIGRFGNWSWDFASDVVSWSEECFRIMGLAPESPVPNFSEQKKVFTEESYARLTEVTNRTIGTGEPYETELEFRWNNGERRWVTARGEAVRGPDGNILRLRGTIQDITDRKLVEKQAHSSAAWLKSVLDQAPVGIFLADQEGKLEYLNPAGVETWGAFKKVGAESYSEYQGWSMDTGERIRSDEWALAHAILKGENVPARKLRIKTFDGKEKFILNAASPVLGKNGEILGAVAVSQDITDVVRAEQERNASAERFRTLAAALPQMVFTSDDQGRITYYNERFRDYIGADTKISGLSWKDEEVIHPEDLQRTLDTWNESIQSGKEYQIEYRLRRSDGVYRWHLGRAIAVRDASGKITEWLGTNTDIHEQKQFQIELERALRTRDEFISVASHELKTPLSSMKIQAQMLKRGIEKGASELLATERLRKFADQTVRQIDRLVRLVEDMLDVSRIDAGKLQIETAPAMFGDIVKEAVERILPQLASAGATVIIERLDLIEGEWDQFRIEQVLVNLLNNAIRYGKGRPVHIRVEENPSKSWLRLIVRDEGMGISNENLMRIFDRFERAVPSSEVSGMGLGLYISREIAKRHGGDIRVESEVGRGSTFIVDLPVRPSLEAKAAS